MGVACRGVACGTCSVAVVLVVYRGREMTIDGWDWCGRHGGAFIWPVAGGDKPLAVAARHLAPARRAPPSSPVERVPIGHSMRCAVPRNIRRIYIPVGTFFSATGSLILTQQILTCTYRYHCIVHVPAYSRTGRQVYTVTSYMKALQHVAGTWPSLLRAWTRSPGDAQTLGATHTQASIFDPIVSWANTRSGRDIFYWALHNPSSRRSQIMARRVKQGPSQSM